MPIDYTRRSYPGAATSTTLSAGVGTSDLSVTVASTTGWPTSGGPFFIVIDPGQTQEEKLLISTVSGTTLTVSARGADGTVAAAHASGATVYPCFTATDADTANAHYNDAADNHTQYLNVARHDVTARHAFGAAFATPSTPPATGTSGSAGVAGGPARSDHSHAIGAGSVVAGSFAAGAITNNDISGSAAISASKLQAQFLTPGTYGDGTHVAQTTVNQQGVVTGITQTAISFPSVTIPLANGNSATVAGPFSPSSTGSFFVVTGTDVNIANPGRQVVIRARVDGDTFNITDASAQCEVRCGISTDGGSTWTYGASPVFNLGTNPGRGDRQSFSVGSWTKTTPTGAVHARLEYQATQATAANYSVQNMFVELTAVPA